MERSYHALGEIKLVGITARTSNSREMDPDTAKIGQILGRYFKGGLSSKIANRLTPGVTYCIYTNYDSNEHGEYSYFVGEAVASFEDMPEGFQRITIPSQAYTVFTVGPGQMPGACIDAWKKIWAMDEEELGAPRRYLADFEIYDERAIDAKRAVFDIYVGIDAS